MSNLLKEASILLTPTAYDNGRMLAVKPEIALGEELVTNGDFATDLSGWNNSNNHWEWASQGAYHPLISTNNPLNQVLTNTIGVRLKITFTLNIIQGTANFFYYNTSNSSVQAQYTQSGTYTIYTVPVKANTSINFSRYAGINTEFYVDNVSVKEDLSGDFQFSRNSAATRVNAQGLVENVQILSSNLVSNGDFSQEGVQEISNGSFSQEGSELVTNGDFATDADWLLENGAVINNGSVNLLGNNSRFRQTPLISGKSYKLVYEVISTDGGSFRFQDGVTAFVDVPQTIGIHTYYFKSTGDRVQFQATSAIDARIDNVSVKEVAQDWDLGAGWSIGEDEVSRTAQSGSTSTYQNVSFTANKSYKITYDLDINAGSFL